MNFVFNLFKIYINILNINLIYIYILNMSKINNNIIVNADGSDGIIKFYEYNTQ